MPAPIRLTLDAAAYRELADRSEATRDADTRLRYHMVLLAADGFTAPQIAPLVRRSTATVERVLRRYLSEGPSGVPHRVRPGRRPTAPPAWAAELTRVIDLDPHIVGVPSATWSVRLLADYLATATGHRASLSQTWRALHQHELVCKRPVHSVKHKAQGQPEWPKKVSGWRGC
jgi:transposase